MSFNDYEHSVQDGLPVEFYLFEHGSNRYRYTSADQDITFNGQRWTAAAITCPGIRSGGSEGLELTVPSDLPVVMLYRGTPPSTSVKLRVLRKHADAASDAESRTVWIGTITEVKREGYNSARIITASAASSFSRNGLRLGWTRACPHSLYDSNCTVSRSALAVNGLNITALNGAEITVNIPGSYASGWFSGGLIAWENDGLTERRGLKTHSGNVIGVLGGTIGLSVGMTVSLWPGCDRTLATCEKKYKNQLNYGGVPHMPGVSPYEIVKLF